MRGAYIPKALREKVAADSLRRCGYCLTCENVVGAPMEFDHLIPVSAGGSTVEDNLWLACPSCNTFKATRVTARDPVSKKLVALFNPRVDVWSTHFAWSPSGDNHMTVA